MERKETWKEITEKGKNIKRHWEDVSRINNIKIRQSGIPALSGFG